MTIRLSDNVRIRQNTWKKTKIITSKWRTFTVHTKRARRPGSRAHNIIGVHYTELAAAAEEGGTRAYTAISANTVTEVLEIDGEQTPVNNVRRRAHHNTTTTSTTTPCVCVCVHNEPQPPSDKKNDRYYYVSYVFIFFVLFCRESPEIYERAKWQIIIIISYTHRIILLLSCVLY
ncbi:unnamed protein product [Aphis gossypii]|uniref:Uncharacterized protein n=1 Tax=Aphis gossypii TaxID=80765 RepID=A0A9P0NLN9_APHGO|nr:unnamed protein product [Aphis gossypii]